MVVDDEAGRVAAFGQDQITLERSDLHPFDLDIFRQLRVAGNSLRPSAHHVRRGVWRRRILGSHFEDAIELLFGHRRSPVKGFSREPLDAAAKLVLDKYVF